MNESPGSASRVLSPRVWWPAVCIVSAGLSVAGAIQFSELGFSGRPVCDLEVVAGVTEAALFVWLMRFSRLSPIRRVKALAVAVVVLIVLPLAIAIEGYRGDGRPMLVWRWVPSPEQKFRESYADVAPVADVSSIDTTNFPTSVAATDSPQFRGPDRSGVFPAVPLAADWNRDPPRMLWKRAVGLGWSSFAVAGDYCVTQEQRGNDEVVVCYELRSGRELWIHRDIARFHEMMGGDGPRATPAIDGGRIYSIGATGILNCLEGSTGKNIWARNILQDAGAENRPFGIVGSPLVMDGKVIVCPGGIRQSLSAYDAVTGELRWGAGSAPAAYSSPVQARLAGRSQILIFNAEGLFSHAPETGSVLWSFPWVTPPELNNVCQPVPVSLSSSPDSDHVFISSGYNKGCALLAIERDGEQFHVRPVWQNTHLKAKFSSVVRLENCVFGLDERILTCLDLSTGARRWKGGRYGFGQLIRTGGFLLIQAESGELALVDASTDRFRERARFPALSHRTWNLPTLAGRLLLVRNDREAACYELAIDEPGK